MFCQYCLSTEPSTLVSMQSHYLEQNGLQISYLDCFKQCKQIKIEDEQSAKICTNCIPTLTEEYTLKKLKNDQANCENNIHCSIAPVKKEPELNLDSWCIPDDTAELQITISVPSVNIEENSVKTESMIQAVSASHQTVLFHVAEIKEEVELHIVERGTGPDLYLTNSNTPG
jgi:hypothetical protein